MCAQPLSGVQAPLSMGFSRQEYWSGFPPPQDLPNSDGSSALAGGFITTGVTWENKETGTQTHTCTPRFIAALLTRVKRRKQPKCPSVDEWLDTWSVYARECYTATKRNEILIHATVWTNLKHIMLSQSSQIQKITFYDSISMTCPK